MNKKISGRVPGVEYTIAANLAIPLADLPLEDRPSCILCGRQEVPLMQNFQASDDVDGVCETCLKLAAWAWDHSTGAAATMPFDAATKNVLVLIVRPRENDFVAPHDVLMIARKDEEDAFGIPGGKLERNEAPDVGAVRELLEETGIHTWPAALELLYTGLSIRGRQTTTFLCRAWHGEPHANEGLEVAWKPWPPMQHAKHLAGYYVGLALAFEQRVRLQKTAQSKTPLSLFFNEAPVEYLTRTLALGGAKPTPEKLRMLEGWKNALTPDEVELCNIVLLTAERQRNAKALIPHPLGPSPAPPAGATSPEEDAPGDEGEDEDADEGDGEGDKPGGFLRPAPPRRPSRDAEPEGEEEP